MPFIKRGYMSTSKIAKFFELETGFLFNYLCEQGLLYKNESKNRFELTESGMLKGGEYQSNEDETQWVIWDKNFIYDDIFDEFILNDTSMDSEKHILMNMWNRDDLKTLFELIRNKKSIEVISQTLNIDQEDIIKKIDALPRIKKLYKAYSEVTEIVSLDNTEDEATVKTKTEEYKEIIQFLSDGTNPFTGEVFDHTHICQNVNVVRALVASVNALEKEIRREKRKSDLPLNAGKSWTDEEDKELITKFNEGIQIKDLSVFFERTIGSIRSRLLNMGIFTENNLK